MEKNNKPRMSAFEHVFLSIADPQKAAEYEPYTYWEEMEMRQHNLLQKEVELLSKMKHRTPSTPNT